VNDRAPAAATARRLARRRGDYGVDAPFVPIFLGGVGAALLCFAALNAWVIRSAVGAVICLVYGLFMLLSMASYLHTTRAGKFHVWSALLAQLGLRGDEQVLDLGCGRGTVLLMVAELLPEGQAVGVDLWKTSDQSGNALAMTRRNAEREGVAERVALYTADMRALPFPDASFDLVLSSLAIHNLSTQAGRLQSIDEAVQVLKPGGRLLIADFRTTEHYAERLRHLGLTSVAQRGLGWRFWYGGPWGATRLVSATKPA
jgi:arsenite methyltransferase